MKWHQKPSQEPGNQQLRVNQPSLERGRGALKNRKTETKRTKRQLQQKGPRQQHLGEDHDSEAGQQRKTEIEITGMLTDVFCRISLEEDVLKMSVIQLVRKSNSAMPWRVVYVSRRFLFCTSVDWRVSSRLIEKSFINQ